MSVRTTPVSMEARVLSKTGRLGVSVYPHMEEISVRPVSSNAVLQWKLLHAVRKRKPMTHSHSNLSSVTFSDLEQCEPGWDKFHGFCYRHFSQRLSWEVAEQHCRMVGAHLVSIMSPEEQDYINSRLRPSGFNPHDWVIYFLSPKDWKMCRSVSARQL